MIFQYGLEPVIIQRIIIGFEAKLENIFSDAISLGCYGYHLLKIFNTDNRGSAQVDRQMKKMDRKFSYHSSKSDLFLFKIKSTHTGFALVSVTNLELRVPPPSNLMKKGDTSIEGEGGGGGGHPRN